MPLCAQVVSWSAPFEIVGEEREGGEAEEADVGSATTGVGTVEGVIGSVSFVSSISVSRFLFLVFAFALACSDSCLARDAKSLYGETR